MVMVKALLMGLFPVTYKHEVTETMKMSAISVDPTKVFAVMAEVGTG